jgi:CubicO group peptidase (beta-lactamase class C family)
MRKFIFFLAFASLLSIHSVPVLQSAQNNEKRVPQRRLPRKESIDAARLARIPGRMQKFVDLGRAAGIVTLVAHKGAIVNFSAVGSQDLETKLPIRPDTMFQIASMTKPITAVGIMILVEDGLLALTDPVEKYLPKFAEIKLQVKAAEPGQGGELAEIRKPVRPITIIDLLTHTSGMGGGYPDQMRDLFNKRNRTLAEAVDAFPQRPLEFEPGSKWGYSNMGIATLGRIIEIVSQKPYEEFMAERIFQPLGMRDSYYFVPESKHNRIAAIYKLEGNHLTRADIDIYRKGARYSSPEAGLYTTAFDLFLFYQMMLNGGAYNNQRILSQASVELMTQVHTDSLKAGFSPGIGYGLGWAVVKDVEGMFRLNSIGTFGHGGLYRTYGFIDPKKELIGIILMQRLSGDGDMADEISSFIAMASAAVVGN